MLLVGLSSSQGRNDAATARTLLLSLWPKNKQVVVAPRIQCTPEGNRSVAEEQRHTPRRRRRSAGRPGSAPFVVVGPLSAGESLVEAPIVCSG